MKHLKKIPTDCTFDQGTSVSKLSRFFDQIGVEPQFRYNHRKVFYSSTDLEKATDRFSSSFIYLVLTELFGQEKASAWIQVMSGIPFDFPLYNTKKGVTGTYPYSAGQPQGGYSSWAVFAYCHHVAVQIAAKRAG